MNLLSVQQEFLMGLATTVWDRRGAAKRTGLQFNEETATELLLLDLKIYYPGKVAVYPFNKKVESATGADWAWAFVDSDGVFCQGMLVQAKRLDDADKRYRQLRHKKIRPQRGSMASQMDQLIDTARRWGLPPIYAFYNHLDDPRRLVNKCGSLRHSASTHAGSWGVTLASALTVRHAMPDDTFDCHRCHSRPLHCLLCTRGAGDHAQAGLAHTVSSALTELFSANHSSDEADRQFGVPFQPQRGLPEMFVRAQLVGEEDTSGKDGMLAELGAEYPGVAGVVIVQDLVVD